MTLFIENKYTSWYFAIVSQKSARVKGKEYFERHHIIPKALGGSNHKSNLVLLTAREHYICHWLLTKMCINTDHKTKMLFAMSCLSWNNSKMQRITSGWKYELEKKFLVEACQRRKMDPIARDKMRQAKLGVKQKPEYAEARRIANTGQKRSAEFVEAAKLRQKGIPHPKTTCPHCGIVGSVNRLKGHHFDKCKSRVLEFVI